MTAKNFYETIKKKKKEEEWLWKQASQKFL